MATDFATVMATHNPVSRLNREADACSVFLSVDTGQYLPPGHADITFVTSQDKGPSLRPVLYSGRKITESLGNVTVRGEKYGISKGGARWPTV
jgi:hypothetical protein